MTTQSEIMTSDETETWSLPVVARQGRRQPGVTSAADLLGPEFFEKMAQMIAAAPDDVPPTPEEIATQESARQRQKMAARQAMALGQQSGWPVKYLEAVKTAPHGADWLEAYEQAAERVRQNGIVVLYGRRGSGKTRMAAELAVQAGLSRYRTAMRFFLEIRATFRKGAEDTEMKIIDDLTRTGLLVLDEIQERGETGFEDRLLTHVIDARYAAMKPTVIIANLTKKELSESLGASVVDRACENGKSIEFHWGSYR